MVWWSWAKGAVLGMRCCPCQKVTFFTAKGTVLRVLGHAGIASR